MGIDIRKSTVKLKLGLATLAVGTYGLLCFDSGPAVSQDALAGFGRIPEPPFADLVQMVGHWPFLALFVLGGVLIVRQAYLKIKLEKDRP